MVAQSGMGRRRKMDRGTQEKAAAGKREHYHQSAKIGQSTGGKTG